VPRADHIDRGTIRLSKTTALTVLQRQLILPLRSLWLSQPPGVIW
jgi:hypothetical protein